jgi:hypothetical protein
MYARQPNQYINRGLYSDLGRHVLEIVLTSIATERMQANFIRLLRLAQVYLMEDAGKTRGLSAVIVKTILDKVGTSIS